jgi:hypothetical protein
MRTMHLQSATVIALTLLSALHPYNTAAGAVRAAAASGSVCVSSVPDASPGDTSLGNPAGGGRTFNYAVRIDNGRLTAVPHDKGVRISGLRLGRRHVVRIYRDGKLAHSFRFTFEQQGSPALCLWYKALYETWSLWPQKDAKSNCTCP